MDVIIAESDAELVDLYRQFLGRSGLRVSTASGGVECLILLRHCLPSVLALDLDLPWGGADGLLTHLREQHPPRRLPPVILTGQVPEEQLPTGLLASPVIKYLCKPFSLLELLVSVRGCMPETREEGSSETSPQGHAPNGPVLSGIARKT